MKWALLLLLPGLALADEPAEDMRPLEVREPLEQNMTPWVVDSTYSALGQNFFRAFSQIWQQKPVRGAYVITVEESREEFFGHRMKVMVSDKLLAQAVFYPNQSRSLGDLGQRTADLAFTRLIELLTPRTEDNTL